MKVIALLACLMVLISVAPVMAREQPNNEIVVEKFIHYVAPPWVTTDENDKSYKLYRGGVKWSTLPVT